MSEIAPDLHIADISDNVAPTEGVNYITTNGTGAWASIPDSGTNYYYTLNSDGLYDTYSSWVYQNTAKVDWNPFHTYNKLQDMYCECCGVHTQVLPEDYRLNYVCDDCKDSVPLLILMRKFFRELES